MKQKIFKTSGILICMAVLLTFLFVSMAYYSDFSEQLKQSVRTEGQYLKTALKADALDMEDVVGEVAKTSENRLTLIDTDGTVLYDSLEDSANMENHLERPEIKSARTTGTGENIRMSTTLGEKTFYYAVRLDNDQYLRVAYTTKSIFSTLFSSFTLVGLILIFVLVIALLFCNRQTKKIIAPINELNLEKPLENNFYVELTPLLKRIDKQNHLIQEQVQKLKQNHEEYLTITENMKDGMIITNQSVVLGINKAATKLFHVTTKECLHKNIMTVCRNHSMREALELALAGTPNEKILELNGKVLQILANPVSIQEDHSGAIILVLDITEKQMAEARRREFSANVSHELKTPLMSISGYAELMMNNMVKSSDIPEFSSRIYTEANRLTTLVEDIIKLSRLDEKGDQLQYETIDLYSVTQDILSCLQLQAQKKNVTLSLDGDRIELYGVRQVIYEMIYNLCDNAIKYNVDRGKVQVHLSQTEQSCEWVIEDTGIGIEEEHIDRIFERFYRVDKSHSKETGGTGLGLSIVKHGVMLHGGTVKVHSHLGQGTKIVMRFPVKER